MADAEITIKYDGGDANSHAVDMRMLGQSFIGFERIITDGIILLSANRLPKRGERAFLKVKAKDPVIGSSEIPVDLSTALGMLPLGWWLLQTGAGEIVGRWVSFVLSYYGGRRREADGHLDAIVRLREIEARERATSDAMWHQQMSGCRDQAFALLSRHAFASQQAVAPVGPSVDTVNFFAGDAPQLTVDVPMADAIRSRGELEVGDLQTMVLKTDGFVYHSRILNVEHPFEPGHYLSANVRDPAFDQEPNAYTDAARIKATITVQAKPAYRAGRLERIYIMDFGEVRDDAA